MVVITPSPIYARRLIKTRPKAYSYIRFSTPEQAKGDSLGRQLKLSQDYAEKHGFVLDDSLSLRDLGLSGFKKHNITKGALGGFLIAVEKGIVPRGSLLLVESLDRISRAEITEQMSLFMTLVNAGITIVTLADGMSYSKETINRQVYELLYSLVIMSRGYEESATKSKRLKSSWVAKRANAHQVILTARCPAWLRVDKAADKFIEIKDRCDLVREMFRLADSGIGKERITKHLNLNKVPVWGGGTGWHPSYIQKILQNRAVLGEFQPHRMQEGKRVPEGEPIADYFPRIISDEVFFRTLNRRSANARLVGRARTSTANLFSGLLKDGYTGASVVYINKGKLRYLVADNARRGLGGVYLSWPYNDFETSFFAFLKELNFRDLLDDEWKMKRELLEAQIRREVESKARLEKSLERLVAAIAEGTSSKTIMAKIASIESQVEEIDKRISVLNEEGETQRQLDADTKTTERTTRSLLARKNEPEAREQLRQEIRRQVEKIVVFGGGPKKGLRPLFDMVFSDLGIDRRISAKELKNSPELQDEIVANLAKSFNDRNISKKIPTDRSRRYFEVHFKTGAVKRVMPDGKDPAKFQRLMFTAEIKAGEVPDLIVELGSGMSVKMASDNTKKRGKKATKAVR